jgi:hypothetical protein
MQESVQEYVEVEVYDGRLDEVDGPGSEDWEQVEEREPVGVGVQGGHRVVDVAAMERAEAERAGLGQRVNLQ